MKKEEKFIVDYTRRCSNEILVNGDESYTNIPNKGEYHPWLTPDQALEAVEIAKEELIKKVINFLNYKLDDVVAIRVSGTIIPHHVAKQELIEDFKKYMKGEEV